MLLMLIGTLILLITILVWLLLNDQGSGKQVYNTTTSHSQARLQAYQLRQQFQPVEEVEEEIEEDDENQIPSEPIEAVPLALAKFDLIDREALSPDKEEALVEMASHIRRPRSIMTPLTMSHDDPKVFAQLVASDAEIAARILRTVNSAAFKLEHKITSVQHAVVYLGTNLVRNIALQLSVQDNLKFAGKDLKVAYHKFWVAGFIASSLCLRVSTHYNLEEPSSLATRSLLSFIGNLAILSHHNDLLEPYMANNSLFARTKMEQECLGANAAVIGTLLAKHWRLPDGIVNGINQSLNPMTIDPALATRRGLKETIMCYTCCRIGEMVAFNNLADIAHVNFEEKTDMEYFFLPTYLKATGLERFQFTLSDRKIRSEVNKLIHRLS